MSHVAHFEIFSCIVKDSYSNDCQVLLQSIQLIEITIQKLTQSLLQILKEVMENRCYADVFLRGIDEEIF